jgi:hypothetical protein
MILSVYLSSYLNKNSIAIYECAPSQNSNEMDDEQSDENTNTKNNPPTPSAPSAPIPHTRYPNHCTSCSVSCSKRNISFMGQFQNHYSTPSRPSHPHTPSPSSRATCNVSSTGFRPDHTGGSFTAEQKVSEETLIFIQSRRWSMDCSALYHRSHLKDKEGIHVTHTRMHSSILALF